MGQFSHHSARVRTSQRASGLHVAEYTGFFNGPAWQSLERHVERERTGSAIGVNLAYAAINDTTDQLDDLSFDYLAGTPPGVWVVRPDQYPACLHVARRLAGMGITRTVFLQSFEALAFDFATRQCLVSRQ